MKRFNTFYLSLMSFFVVFEVIGMDDPNTAWMYESQVFPEKNTVRDPLGESSLAQDLFTSSLGVSSTPQLLSPAQVNPKNQSLQQLENLRNSSQKWIELNKSTDNIAKLDIFDVETSIRNALRSQAGQLTNLLQTDVFINSIQSIIDSPSVTREVIMPFKMGLDTIYYSSNPQDLCPDLIKIIPSLYNIETKQLDTDLFNSAKNLLTIFNTTNKNQQEKQTVIDYLQQKIEALPMQVENPNKTNSLVYTITSLIQVLCGENILTIADNIKKSKILSISAKIVILKVLLQKVPKKFVSESQRQDIVKQINNLKKRKHLFDLHKKLKRLKIQQFLFQPGSQDNLKNLIEYRNTLQQYIDLTTAGFAEKNMQETLAEVSQRIDFLTKKTLDTSLNPQSEKQVSIIKKEDLSEKSSIIAPQIPKNYSSERPAPITPEKSSDKSIELLPYPSLDNTLLISRFFPQINLAIATNNQKQLTQVIQDFRNAYRPFELISVNTSSELLAEVFFIRPDGLKKLIKSRLKYKNESNCKLISFFLHEIYKYQLAQDDLSKNLAQLTQHDLVSLLADLQISHQWLSYRSPVVNAIISDGLDPQKMQACLALLNRMCNFYKINDDVIEIAINQIGQRTSDLLKKQNATEIKALIATTGKRSQFFDPTSRND